MSRAFVSDGAPDARDDEAPELKIPIPPGSRNYLTPEGAAALAEELSALETELGPSLGADIEKASKAGADEDTLSSLRRTLARANRRIEYLSRMAALAETIEAPANGYERVSFGASVRVRDEAGEERSYRIVGVDEADPERGLIGWNSPIARALIGKRAGERATAKLPERELTLTIISVE